MAELERESPTSANWSHQHFESLFKTTAPELSKYFVLVAEDQSKSGSATVSAPTSSMVAYLAAHCIDNDWELQYIVVAKKSRRRGVATSLMNEFFSHVRATGGSQISLEVRESNHDARRLYSALGFTETGLRRSYYSNPPEDAILCRLRFY
jgi:ribosomal-protein-alanine N-acetyltransferase